jgi:hypothetical protein
MSDEIIGDVVAGGLTGAAVGGLPGAVVGGGVGALTGLLREAYEAKPKAGTFATTLQNDLVPENVTLDAHQIYVRITSGHGPDSLVKANAAAALLSNNFTERASQITAAQGVAAGAWQGGASTAASSATSPLSDSFAVAQQQLAANATALDAEVTAFDHIRSQVEPVPATPPQSSLGNDVNPFQSDTDAAINAYNAKAAKNVALYEAYNADTTAARGQVPKNYAQPAPLNASASAVTRTASPVGPTSAATPKVGPGGPSQSAATDASAAAGGDPAAPPTPGGTPGQSGGASDTPGRQTPAATTPSGATPGGVPLLPGGRDTMAGGPLSSRARRAAEAQRKFAGAGGGPGSGGPGGIGSFGGGTGSGSGNGLRSGSSVGTGPVPGQGNAGQQAGRGGAAAPAARGAAGPGGMPGGAAGRREGDDDQEHRRKYLIEPDDKELFGSDEKWVPPVIGDRR